MSTHIFERFPDSLRSLANTCSQPSKQTNNQALSAKAAIFSLDKDERAKVKMHISLFPVRSTSIDVHSRPITCCRTHFQTDAIITLGKSKSF